MKDDRLMDPTPRYRVRAYLCENGVTMVSSSVGWRTLQQLYNEGKSTCRFAITERKDDEFWLIDLWDIRLPEFMHHPDYTGNHMPEMGQFRRLPTFEAAMVMGHTMYRAETL